MADATYDAVVIGGGHHGTIIAPYLARAGLKVAVFERHPRLGGAAISAEGPAPGFRENVFAHFTRFYSHPAYADFHLRAEGLEYIFPDQNEGIVFDDDTAFVGYSAFRVVDAVSGRAEYAPENVQKTYDQIARFSRRDAEVYLDLLNKYRRHWKTAFGRHRFSPPPPRGTPDPLEALLDNPESGLEPVHECMTVRQLACDFFESAELRTLFMRAASTSMGLYPDDVMGLQGLVHVIALVLSWEPAAIAVGGTQSITDALVAAGRKRGAAYFTRSPVERILVEGGKATGIALADGSRVAARLVVSDLGAPQTFLQLLRDHPIGDRLRHRIRNIVYDRGQLIWGNLALHELPAYTAAAGNPDIGPQPRLYWGPKDPDYLVAKYQHEIFVYGFAQRVNALTGPDSIWDRSRAPEGKHIIGLEEFAAPARLFSPREWARLLQEFQEHLLAEWQRYAPNMTRDNVIAMRFVGPHNLESHHPDRVEGGYTEGALVTSQLGRYRPIPELSGYRTPIPNLYLCSSNVHPGSGIGRGSSYNCYQAIATDFGLPTFQGQQ